MTKEPDCHYDKGNIARLICDTSYSVTVKKKSSSGKYYSRHHSLLNRYGMACVTRYQSGNQKS